MALPLGRLAVIAVVVLAIGVVWFLFASLGSQAPTHPLPTVPLASLSI